jgi:glycosyltransferase involved in cell wall biosynthesis
MAHRKFLADEANSLRKARVVIAISQQVKRDLVRFLSIPPERIHVVYYGNDTAAFFPPEHDQRLRTRQKLRWSPERPVVMFIGALGDRRKGFDTLFGAWKQLCGKSSWDADLVVVGRGAELRAWQKRTTAAGLDGRIRFLGFRHDVPDLLRAADALVAPTRYEAYGLGVQEALCCGLPALVSADAGVAERYPAELQSLLLQDHNSVKELVFGLEGWRSRAAELSEQTARFGEALRARTWDEMARDIVRIAL